MAQPKVEIVLDPGPWDDPQWANCRPVGGTLSGRVVVDLDEPLNPRRVIIRVGWYTQGRGDRDQGVHWEQVVHQGPMSGHHEFPFQLQLPEGPLTYNGSLIQIRWQVEVQFDLAWRRDPRFSRTFELVLA